MSAVSSLTASEALERLVTGNRAYLTARTPSGDISPERRDTTCREGQHPYAVVVTCSDSRVIPESIFSAGIGDLFTVRCAGNVIGPHELGSVEYAASHLGCPLTVVLGHTHCGAVDAALHQGGHGHVKVLTDAIAAAIGPETDPTRASALNALHGAAALRRELGIAAVAALYRIEDGAVEFLEEP